MEVLFEPYTINWYSHNFFYVDNPDMSTVNRVVNNSGSLRLMINQLQVISDMTLSGILKKFEIEPWQGKSGTFRVRVNKLGKQNTPWKSQNLERELGSLVLAKLTHLKVDLRNPEFTIVLIVYSKEIIVGELIKEQRATNINWRSPKNFPYFRGGAMKPLVAKLMVNMNSGPKSQYILDPFCGHAGILLEAAFMGYNTIGVELDGKILRQTQTNFQTLEQDLMITLVMGDALNLPFRRKSVEYAVTDPPYSIQTTTSGKKVETLIELFLASIMQPILVTFAVPNDTLRDLPEGWIVKKSVKDFVHKNLYRHIRLIYHG